MQKTGRNDPCPCGSGKKYKKCCLAASDYAGAIGELTKLTGPINLFFDKVLVMDKDEDVRRNRLSLLSAVWAYAAKAADFSVLEEV